MMSGKHQPAQGEILIYQTELGDTKVDVYLNQDTIWMSRVNIARLYATTPQNISMHIKNIYHDNELKQEGTSKDHLLVQSEGTRDVSRRTKFYNLDMILAIGYRIRSSVGIQFRNWTSNILKEYMKKGFVMNDERLKDPQKFGQDYFDELLERIRDIRASEKRFYQKVRDIYALSVDYNPSLAITKDFFASVQNKMLYAVTGKTAAEIIMERANAHKDNMGLTSFKGAKVRKADVVIAKNYLQKDEFEDLNRIVTMFLDHAEDLARHGQVMTMQDWAVSVNEFLTFRHRKILQDKGIISHEAMECKALEEYAIYHVRQLQLPENEDINLSDLPKKKQ
ncbi:virulence RhuM family protein [Pectinatus haikarae]|uniref:Uncharacterized protein n=1 Tax=Pectinatus haikarae TaxID=349096 RepID=A0ABT9YAD4_9FIRM|nr:virulence RhuM family protein [Pectinatus haikarae]MDQ0204598.1 hypothetical protein [Pectinatus haikarae]